MAGRSMRTRPLRSTADQPVFGGISGDGRVEHSVPIHNSERPRGA
jgi:hypothetical protein